MQGIGPDIQPGAKNKNPGTLSSPGFSFEDGVAVTYFRMRKLHTIIGANPFHGPVRDGKAWVQAAMAARLTLGSPLERDVPPSARAAIRIEVKPGVRLRQARHKPFAVLTVIGSSRTGN